MRTGSERAAGTEGLAQPVKPRPSEVCGSGEAGVVVVGGGVEGIGEGGGDGMLCEGGVSGFGERGAVCLGS